VTADVEAALGPRAWPTGAGERPPALARLGAGPDGRLVQRQGRRLSGAAASPRADAPRSAAGRRIYAVGDLHGCYDLLLQLLGRISADAARAPDRPALLIFLGDYIDRGPASAHVLEAMVRLRARLGADLCLLKGNHEQALLKFLGDPAGSAAWLKFGGAETLVSYGVDPPAPDAPQAALVEARDRLLAAMPAAHLHMLQGLDLMAAVGDYAFVHAGVAPGSPLARQDEADLLWIRDEFVSHRGGFEKVVVHGHTWAGDEPVLTPHRLGVDTGAYRTGALTALRIDDEGVVPLQAWDALRWSRWRGRWTPSARPLAFEAFDLRPQLQR
jgi:serine/threonine protein phosphatase 1